MCILVEFDRFQELRPPEGKFDLQQRQSLSEFGQYAAQCLPKFIQKVQLTAGDELELLVSPEGILCVLDFLKGHHNAQFTRDFFLRSEWL